MRTKTLLLTVVLGAASIAAAMAQTVYSVNAVGYVNVKVPAGAFALLANPLNAGTNTPATVLPDAPNGTRIYKVKADGSGFWQANKALGKWSGDVDTTLNPGEGFWVKNGSATAELTLTFVGEVVQGTNVTVNIPAGFSMLGSPIPQAGKVKTDLNLPSKNADKIYFFKADGSGYDIFNYALGKWNPSEPTLGVAQGFWFNAGATGAAWTRSFSVNQ